MHGGIAAHTIDLLAIIAQPTSGVATTLHAGYHQRRPPVVLQRQKHPPAFYWYVLAKESWRPRVPGHPDHLVHDTFLFL